MRRGRSVALLAPLALAGLAAGVLVPGGRADSRASHGNFRVTVAATDFKCTLSRRSVPTGTVIFTVTNRGKTSHAFRIAGKKTPSISSGHTATLRVAFTKAGRYPYLCTGSGVKGIFSVVAPVTIPATTTTTAPPPTVGTATTTVTVVLFDDPGPPRFVLSQSTIPSGMVTFAINNKCVSFCSFNLEGVKAGTLLGPGASETWTVGLPPGRYLFHCDADPVNMRGSLTVTP